MIYSKYSSDIPPDNGVEVVAGDFVVMGNTVVPSPNFRKYILSNAMKIFFVIIFLSYHLEKLILNRITAIFARRFAIDIDFCLCLSF